MINLFTDSEQRKLQFIETLANTSSYQNLSELAQTLDCSVRSLQTDMQFFQDNFTDFKLMTSTKGIRLSFRRGKNLESVYQKMLSDSLAYKLLEWVFLYEGKTISELAEMLNVSTATVYRLIRLINTEIEPYHFRVETNPCRVEGKEEHIRYYYYQYFTEKYSFLNWSYDLIDEESLDDFLQFFIEFTEISADFAFYHIFKSVSCVNLIRYKNQHFVDTDEISINFDEIIPNLDVYADVFRDFEEKVDVKITTEFIHQVFTPYVQDGFSLNPDRLKIKAANDKKVNAIVKFLDQSLSRLSKENGLPLHNKEELIFSLYNASHLEYQEPQSGYILYDKNQYFVDEIKNNFPKFYEHLYHEMKKFRAYIGKPVNRMGINFYVYTLFSFWENLVPELQRKYRKIELLVISNQHKTHGYMIKDFIEYEFSEQINVEIFSEYQLNERILDHLNCDLIVTTFPLTLSVNKEVVYIEHIPSKKDLKKLQTAINRLMIDYLDS